MDIQKSQIVTGIFQQHNLSENSQKYDLKQSFGDTLNNAIKEVNKLQTEADKSVNSLVNGSNTDIHKTMIAMEKADISFKLMMQIRNKAIEVYQEMMRMQV
jgi:flagellar hook-basal body complex protein FliE